MMCNLTSIRITTQLLAKLRKWDTDTYMHSLRVAGYAFRISKCLRLDWQERKDLLVAAMLHDIGKLDIPQSILRKPGKLTDEEYARIRNHTEYGYRRLCELKFPAKICNAVRDHHEQPDGHGYRGCTAPELYADIIRVADCLDVMVAGRRYQTAKTKEQVEEDLRSNAGQSMEKIAVNAALRAFFPKRKTLFG